MKFLIDNCLPPSWGPALTALSHVEGDRVVSLRERFRPDTPDAIWIRELGQSADGPFVIVSGDQRIIRNPHERLAWKDSKSIAFFLHPGWSNYKMWDKTWMFIRWWPHLRAVAAHVAPGAGYIVPVKFGPNKLRPL